MHQSGTLEDLNGIDVSGISSVQKVNDNLYTSGQPTSEQLELICHAGFSTVINLALNDSKDGLLQQQQYEDRLVLEMGMHYVHLPILWDCPSASDALFVLKVIHHLRDQMVWVHCTKNWRVSSLMFLYRRYYMQMPIEQADELLNQIWQPDETWTGLINAVSMQLQFEQQVEQQQSE